MTSVVSGHRKELLSALSSLVLLAGVSGGVAQTAPQQAPPHAGPTPTISVTAREVLLDVLVTDAAGHPVTGLTPKDFTVTEEGAPQTIRRLEEHQLMADAEVARLQATPALPPNTFSNYTAVLNTNASTVVLLDALDTPITSQQYLREQLIAYLKNMQPGASIAIFQLDTEMRLIQGFSSDQEALLAAAESKRNMPSVQQPIRGNRTIYEQTKREILRDGMQMLGRYLAGFPGRKNLIWFTGQVPLTIFGSGLGNPFKDSFGVVGGSMGDLSDLTDDLTISRVAIYPVDTRGLDDGFDMSPAGGAHGHSGASFASRMNNDIYDLQAVAENTGGKAYFNTNGLKDVIAEVVRNGSNYYTLAYATSNTQWNGAYRHIRIVVNRPGVHVQHRQGYYAVNRDAVEQRQIAAIQKRVARGALPVDASQAGAPEPVVSDQTPAGVLVHHPKGGFQDAMVLGAVPPTEIVFTASLKPDDAVQKFEKKTPLPQGNYLLAGWEAKPFRVDTILFNADIHRVKLTQSADGVRHGTLEFATIVYTQEGQPVNSLLSTAAVDLDDATYRALLRTGMPLRQEVAIPVKGNYFLRMGVHDVAGDQMGALEIPVDQVQLGVAGRGLQTP
ncbi:MAG TPA: VWA domain-containing protein [Acidobacteriaceae bacterium]|nr:VWA domain-containing protein [Acidobacteriaceae bacterium]